MYFFKNKGAPQYRTTCLGEGSEGQRDGLSPSHVPSYRQQYPLAQIKTLAYNPSAKISINTKKLIYIVIQYKSTESLFKVRGANMFNGQAHLKEKEGRPPGLPRSRAPLNSPRDERGRCRSPPFLPPSLPPGTSARRHGPRRAPFSRGEPQQGRPPLRGRRRREPTPPCPP